MDKCSHNTVSSPTGLYCVSRMTTGGSINQYFLFLYINCLFNGISSQQTGIWSLINIFQIIFFSWYSYMIVDQYFSYFFLIKNFFFGTIFQIHDKIFQDLMSHLSSLDLFFLKNSLRSRTDNNFSKCTYYQSYWFYVNFISIFS